MPHLLIIDDDLAVCRSLELLLRRAGYTVDYRTRPEEGLQAAQTLQPALVLLDMNFTVSSTGEAGLNLLEKLLAQRPGLPIILITAWATVQLAVEGMKKGARDFLAKPWDNEHLIRSVRAVLDLYGESPVISSGSDTNAFDNIIGQSDELQEVLGMARRVAATEATVLITGESGTGKELVARAIHEASPRVREPFIAVNLGGIPEGLFESELFGHKAGAFTDARQDRQGYLELAEGGTLFLDEIGDLAANGQVKLLRVLQERYYHRLGESRDRKADFRLISATSRVLPELITSGHFREDLLYRINLVTLHLPPLRQRTVDIPILAAHFLRQAAEQHHLPEPELTKDAKKWLQRQHWPGNIRQLRNLMERCLILARGLQLDESDLKTGYQSGRTAKLEDLPAIELADMEERMIRAALSRHGHQITATAAELGLTRPALYRRMEKYGIEHERQ